MSGVAVFLYNIFRYLLTKETILQQGFGSMEAFLSSHMVLIGQTCFPVAMVGIYWLSGYYNNIYRKSILQELATTILSAFVCTLLVFFVALINDTVSDHFRNYEMLLALWGILVVCIYPPRLATSLHIKRHIWRSQIEFPTIIVGSGDMAAKCADELTTLKPRLGYKVIGFASPDNDDGGKPSQQRLPHFDIDHLEEVCRQHHVTDLIVVPAKHEIEGTLHILSRLFPLNLPIKVFSNETDLLFLSRGKLATVYGTPLIDISCSNMTECEANLKRTADIVFSSIALLILLPFFAIIAAAIKIADGGPAIFRQQRVGLHGNPFTIYKFRTMRVDAEADGTPRLTAIDDHRVFPLGHFMRKYRIDELPQFWNVLRGDMSIVGPRPERRHFIDLIVKRAPHYTLLQQVRPGITSLGMVKYGYASSVDEMIERMKYDIIYIENISLVTDLKIVVYTIWTVVTGKGL